MPVHSARRHIHLAAVTGYSFINDQIHFLRYDEWERGADAGQTDPQNQSGVGRCEAGESLQGWLL